MIAIPPPVMAAARGRPDHPAIAIYDRTITWAELAHRASCWARALVDAGVSPGDLVTLSGAVDLDWIARFHAIGLAGAIAAVREIDDASFPVTHPGDTPLGERDWPLDEPRVSLLTSGTSGEKKDVRLTTAQLVFSAMGSAARLGHHVDDRWLSCLPFHHIGGLSILLRTAWLGTTAIVEPRFDATALAQRLDRGEATMISLVPAMLSRILDARENKPFPAALRVILLGGDACPPTLLDRARDIDAPVSLTWGMTETASQVATMIGSEISRKGAKLAKSDLKTLAPFAPLREKSGLDPHGLALRPLPFARVIDSEGALVVEGPIAPSGRLVTQDRGVVHDDGAIEIHGRRDLVFISGGVNVDPARVERALLEHPAIAEALVVGVPDPILGHRAAMILVERAGQDRPDLPAIRAFLSTRLSPAERPSRVAWAHAIPRGSAGKPSRERARALLEESP